MPLGLAVEARAPFYQLPHTRGAFLYHDAHHIGVAESGTGIEGVFDVLVVRVLLKVPHCRHTALSVARIRLFGVGLGEHRHL